MTAQPQPSVKVMNGWIQLLAVVLAAGAFVQTSRTTAATAEQTSKRVEALERNSERTAELQRQTVSILSDLQDRLRNNELADVADSERLTQIRADLDRMRAAAERMSEK